MVKVKAKIDFLYRNYNKIKNLNSIDKIEKGKIFAGDIFEVEKKEAEYLSGNNQKKIVAVEVIQVIPEIKEVKEVTIKGKNKNNKKKEDK
jgi:hypothetical protein